MRPNFLLLTVAAFALGAFPAAASLVQPTEDPAPADPGLSDLGETLQNLEDQPKEAPPADEQETPPPVEAEVTAPAAPAKPAPPLTRAEMRALGETVERGKLLVDLAGAGLIATRDMLTRISDPEGAGISGWIAEPQGKAVDVTFYGSADEAPRTVYRVSVNGGRVVSRDIFLSGDGPALNPVQARMAAARTATDALDHKACSSQPFNVIVIPPASADAPIHVYQISPPEARGRFPLGGHFLATVAKDGQLSDTRPFANGCAMLEAPAPAQGKAAPPIGVVHLLDNKPTEIHMFLAKQAGRPLLVATGEPQRIWLVTGDRIAEVKD